MDKNGKRHKTLLKKELFYKSHPHFIIVIDLKLFIFKERQKKRVLYHAAHLGPFSTGEPNQRDSVFVFSVPFSSGNSNNTNIFVSQDTISETPDKTRDIFLPRGPPSTG